MTADATRRKTIHIHIGPHKTGSTAIQHALRTHAAQISKTCGVTPIQGPQVRDLAKALLNRDEEGVSRCSAELAAICDAVPGDCLISSEDFAGDLPGRTARRRIYPRLWQNLNVLQDAFPGCRVRFYFFCRKPEAWLRSAYVQLLKHRLKFRSFDGYRTFLNGIEELWDETLQKPRTRLGADFVEIAYHEGPEFSAVTALLDAVTGETGLFTTPADTPRPNAAPSDAIVRLMEQINGSSASTEAKRNAKNLLTNGAVAEPQGEPAAVPPDAVARPDWLSPDLAGLWSRVEKRVIAQEQPNLLPDPQGDLVRFRTRIVEASEEFPEGGRHNMENQARILAYRFRGLPETCRLLAMTISYLRRNTDHTAHASILFQRLWAEEHALLLGLLPTRWLISSFQTFMDHGTNEAQRVIGAGAYFFANTLKLYEAERALDGLPPDSTYPHTVPATKNGFNGLDRFRLGGTDLMLNTNALLLEIAAGDDRAGRVVQEFMLRLKAAHSAFSRMDHSRIVHGIDIPQFANCWSFFDKPSGT